MSIQREMSLQEWVYKLPPIHSARKELDLMKATIAQQAALIEQCENVLQFYWENGICQPFYFKVQEALAAIAAHRAKDAP